MPKFNVNVEPYGTIKLTVPETMINSVSGNQLLADVTQMWPDYWKIIHKSTVEMVDQWKRVGLSQFDGGFEQTKFSLRITDLGVWESVMIFAVTFLDDDNSAMTPEFHVSTNNRELFHAQPVF